MPEKKKMDPLRTKAEKSTFSIPLFNSKEASVKESPSFTLANNVIRNSARKIKFKKFTDGGYEHFHIGVWVESVPPRAAYLIRKVEYELHPTFKKRIRETRNRKNDFSITFWSWGTFKIKAKLHMMDGSISEIFHELKYDLPHDDGDNYINVSKI